jgi:hypothetical protein
MRSAGRPRRGSSWLGLDDCGGCRRACGSELGGELALAAQHRFDLAPRRVALRARAARVQAW